MLHLLSYNRHNFQSTAISQMLRQCHMIMKMWEITLRHALLSPLFDIELCSLLENCLQPLANLRTFFMSHKSVRFHWTSNFYILHFQFKDDFHSVLHTVERFAHVFCFNHNNLQFPQMWLVLKLVYCALINPQSCSRIVWSDSYMSQSF